MEIVNVSNFRKDLFKYVNQGLDYDDPIIVNSKKGNMVFISEQEYRNLIATLEILSTPGLHEEILEGLKTPIEECVEVDWRSEL